MKAFWNFVKAEEGLETVEYAVILTFISLGLVAAIVLLSGSVSERFNTTAETVTTGS